mgnify:CR=1 FL=1
MASKWNLLMTEQGVSPSGPYSVKGGGLFAVGLLVPVVCGLMGAIVGGILYRLKVIKPGGMHD